MSVALQAPRRGRRARTIGRSLPLVPAVALLAVFLLGPVIWSLYGSFTNSSLTGAGASHAEWVGLDNYTELFTNPDFLQSAWLTVLFVVCSAVIGQCVLGLGLALLMSKATGWVRGLVGTLVVAAWVLPEIVASFALYAFFHVDGTINGVLAALGVQGPDWLYHLPMLSVILANTWRGTAFSMMVYSAALADVPAEVKEAATMDGAGSWQRFVHVTLPMIRRAISTNLMLITLQTLSVFTLIWVMTRGGPGTKSTTLPILAYQEAMGFGNIGMGTAIATVMLLVGAVFSILYIRVLRPEVD